jgi:hypothetical protein
MGVRHVVMFRWVAGLDDDHVERVEAGLAALPGRIPEIRDYRFGPNLGINPGTYDFVVVADFDDEQAYQTYRDHPDHQAFIAELITGNVADRAAIQFRL